MTLVAFDGPVWRLLPELLINIPQAPAKAPEGRFHHSGQTAAYASLTPEGTAIAMKQYMLDDKKRVLVQMWLTSDAVVDIRGDAAASVVWQDQRAAGEIASTWAISDAARRAGAQAMFYSSRSRPDLSHVVVFDPTRLTFVGPTTPTLATDP